VARLNRGPNHVTFTYSNVKRTPKIQVAWDPSINEMKHVGLYVRETFEMQEPIYQRKSPFLPPWGIPNVVIDSDDVRYHPTGFESV